MSAVIASDFEYPPLDRPDDETQPDQLDASPDLPIPEPRRVHVPRLAVWGVLILFGLALLAAGTWGLAHSTLTYGMAPVDSTTSARLAQIRAELAAAGASETALRHLAIAARPGANIGDAIEALASADQDLAANKDPAILSARQELYAILEDLSARYTGRMPASAPAVNATPWPILPLPTP